MLCPLACVTGMVATHISKWRVCVCVCDTHKRCYDTCMRRVAFMLNLRQTLQRIM